MKVGYIVTGLALTLAGCATTQEAVPVATDTFCITARKRTWDIADTPETIRDARAWNKLVDLRCGVTVATK